jgi:hypothetical protein
MIRSELWSRAVLLASLTAGLACDTGGGGKKAACENCDAPNLDSGPGPGEELGGLKGRVFDADTGRAVDDADLKSLSGETTKSDAKGNFELKSAKDTQEVEVSKLSYAATVKRPPPKGGYMEVYIKDVDNKTEFEAEKGVKVVLASGASVDIPPGAVRDAEGKSVTGTMTLTVSDVDGDDRKQGAVLPELKGERGTEKGRVSLYRAMDLKIVDKDGKNLTVGKDDKVVAEFPAKEASGPALRSGLSYDEEKDLWVEDGKAKRTVNDKGETVYRKDIDHLSWHGYGDFFAKVTCLRACVQDGDAKALPGAQVWLVGASFPGVSTLFTGEDGCVSGDAPAGQDVVLVGQVNGGVSKALTYKTSDSAQSAEADPAACDAGAAPLVIGKATPGSCPAGFNECEGACSDPATDEANCGECGTVCAGPAGRAQVCSSGACGCPAGLTACGDACVDTNSDPLNCGSCGVNVNADAGPDVKPQQCVEGQPVELTCQYPEEVCGDRCIDVYTNEANCGQCGMACAAGQVCLSRLCQDLTSSNLCSGPNPMYTCDQLFCNGPSTCNPESNLAIYNGCVNGAPPCAQGATCDEATDTCGPAPACVATNYVKIVDRCSANIGSCLATIDAAQNLGSAIACGAGDQTPPSGTDELGQDYDCESCLRIDLMICAKNYGCAEQVNALDCCVQAAKCTSQSCIQQLCATQFDAVDTCLDAQTQQGGRCYQFITGSLCMPQ